MAVGRLSCILGGRRAPKKAIEEVPLFAPLQECDIERWSQTTLHRDSQRRPRIEAWLHGKQDTYPDTEIRKCVEE